MVIDEHAPEPTPVRTGTAGDWAYPRGQAELGLLHQLVSEGRAAAPNVHYAQNLGLIERQAWFRPAEGTTYTGKYCLRSTGTLEAFGHDGHQLTGQILDDGTLRLSSFNDLECIRVTTTDPSTPAGLLPLIPGAEVVTWDAQVSGLEWLPVQWRTGSIDTPPHRLVDEVVEVRATEEDGIFDLGTPQLGRLVVEANTRPEVVVGESRAETYARADESECPIEMIERESGLWISRHESGFRYIRTLTADVRSISVLARVHPVPVRGTFACSDPRLEEIWATAARTLHRCMRGLVLDGIKRDRMPWIGDQALATIVNAYTVGDPKIVRDGITALGQAQEGYINGICDYSLWWVITTRTFLRYFDSGDFLTTEGPRIETMVTTLASYTNDDGVLQPPELPHTFMRVFIDWGVETDPERDSTALQMLWLWALDSAIALLPTNEARTQWVEIRARLLRTLRSRAWNEDEGLWNEYLDGPVSITAYANFLAVLNGLSTGQEAGITALLERTERVGTPFMTSFLLRGLAQAGNPELAVDRIQALWAGMLDAGALTFWEEFPELGRSPYEMYGRPFGKSLCHGWSAGPAAMLPEMILGLRPLADDWTRFEVTPHLGALRWAHTTIPTSHGEISVRAEKSGRTLIDIPAGTTLVLTTHNVPGPAHHEIAATTK